MTASASSDPQIPKKRAWQRLRPRAARHGCAPRHSATPSTLDEAGFWEHLEEREFGRAALEADHLFDTSHKGAP